MMNTKNLIVVFLLGLLCVASDGQPVWCQEANSPQEQMLTSETPADAKLAGQKAGLTDGEPKLVGRLPRYFAAVVLPEQRLQIYRIQTRYRGQIEDLQRRLDELKTAESEEVEAVLSANQLQQVMAMREQARQRLQSRYSAANTSPASAVGTQPETGGRVSETTAGDGSADEQQPEVSRAGK